MNKSGSLFKKAKKGDIEAFEKLAEPYYKKVFNIALKIAGNCKDASELSQEVFVRVYKSIKSLEEESLVPLYIYKTTREVCTEKYGEPKNAAGSKNLEMKNIKLMV